MLRHIVTGMPYVIHKVLREALNSLDMSTERLAEEIRRPVRTTRNVAGAHQVASVRTIVQIARTVKVPIEQLITDKSRVQQDAEVERKPDVPAA